MEETESVDLIRLADRPGLGGQSVSVRVTGRSAPGALLGHDWLDCEIVITTEVVHGCLPVVLTPDDVEDWERKLDELAGGRSASWPDSGRGPELTVQPTRNGGMWVSVGDPESSGVVVKLPLAPAAGWVEEQRALLARVSGVFPRETVETSPGVFVWRR
ncbi:DUF5959 family protein [Streptomyces sp. BE303]|uniref:DUF5959 family protein n=1 Tax=Streptomyces sp. BE303 TaxID=3002528 RepID=UPI002E7A6ACC|nr:DUF5959 family protein [Streptomyces sp. BE303]MED7951543.1 DUF5959 family protein [Streptomyces sp. BE303]